MKSDFRQIPAYLTHGQVTELDRVALALGCSRNAAIRQVVEEGLRALGGVAEVGKRASERLEELRAEIEGGKEQ